MSSLVSAAVMFHSTSPCLSLGDDEYFGDTTTSVGSININIFAPGNAGSDASSTSRVERPSLEELLEPKNEIDKLLNNIPSWKYYKIISQEYSRRSSDFNGEVNFLAPLL